MYKYLSKRAKGFFIKKLPAHLLILLALWLIMNVRTWVVFFIFYLVIIAAGFIYEIFRAWRYSRERIYTKEARRLMFLVRNLIDLAFIYDEDPDKFYRKFLEAVSVDSLSMRGIINPDALLRTPKYNRMYKKMRREDAELWTLIMAEFNNRELKVIYGLTNINSVYIKRHRMKSRLEKRMQELLEDR